MRVVKLVLPVAVAAVVAVGLSNPAWAVRRGPNSHPPAEPAGPAANADSFAAGPQ